MIKLITYIIEYHIDTEVGCLGTSWHSDICQRHIFSIYILNEVECLNCSYDVKTRTLSIILSCKAKIFTLCVIKEECHIVL
jgi:hypothetical protein